MKSVNQALSQLQLTKDNPSYLRIKKVMYGPLSGGYRELLQEHKSINAAKRHSRELMKQGKQIITEDDRND